MRSPVSLICSLASLSCEMNQASSCFGSRRSFATLAAALDPGSSDAGPSVCHSNRQSEAHPRACGSPTCCCLQRLALTISSVAQELSHCRNANRGLASPSGKTKRERGMTDSTTRTVYIIAAATTTRNSDSSVDIATD